MPCHTKPRYATAQQCHCMVYQAKPEPAWTHRAIVRHDEAFHSIAQQGGTSYQATQYHGTTMPLHDAPSHTK
jgi:hypothetical protein